MSGSVPVGVQPEPLVHDLKLEFLEAKLEAMDIRCQATASICTQTMAAGNTSAVVKSEIGPGDVASVTDLGKSSCGCRFDFC